ncbi:Mitochondrial ATPase complex subunit atp10, partial [Spiromyces aspiralis]
MILLARSAAARRPARAVVAQLPVFKSVIPNTCACRLLQPRPYSKRPVQSGAPDSASDKGKGEPPKHKDEDAKPKPMSPFDAFKPKPKQHEVIIPGEAVGQSTPATGIEHVPLRERIEQKFRDAMDKDKNLRKREEIIRKIGESYWQDVADLHNHGAKLFEAPTDLIPAGASTTKYMPNLEAKNLNSDQVELVAATRGKVALVTLEFTKFAESFGDPFIKQFGDQKNAKYIRVNVEENWLKAALLKACLPYIRAHIPKDRH